MIPHWMLEALCQRFPALPWIAEPGDRSAAGEQAMNAVCGACPVRRECESYADRRSVTSGYWAGTDRSVDPLDLDEDGAA